VGFTRIRIVPILTRTALAVQVTVVQGRVTDGAFPSAQLSLCLLRTLGVGLSISRDSVGRWFTNPMRRNY
jgi:hypothetical protein